MYNAALLLKKMFQFNKYKFYFVQIYAEATTFTEPEPNCSTKHPLDEEQFWGWCTVSLGIDQGAESFKFGVLLLYVMGKV